MRRVMMMSLALSAVAACKKTPTTCKELGPVIVAWGESEIVSDKLNGSAAEARRALFAMSAELYPRVCEKSRWSGAAIDCLIAAKTEDDAQRCELTKDQRDDLQKALIEALTGSKGDKGEKDKPAAKGTK